MSLPTFRLYDSLTRETKPLETQEPGHLRFYTCGPTVYSYAHIGNFRSFLTADLVVRTAQALGMRTTWVTNITDVGHLTQDDVADAAGEDKMERALRSKEGEAFHNVWELAEFYTDAYQEDWARLNLTTPDIRPKATQHVSEQIRATQELIDKGFAYETPTGVYFSVSAFPEYGKLSGNTQDALRSGTREVVQDDNKRDSADFALWKKDEAHLMQWFSPFGWGFPGWHIECSVMARQYLGDTLDLHSGGEDNAFPHHECEIAQSESLTGKPFSNHWLHTRFLQVNGAKMSKSLGNFYTVRGVAETNPRDMLALRYALISGVFGKPLNFTDSSFADAKTNVDRLQRALTLAREASADGEDTLGPVLNPLGDELLEAMANNLNTPVALAKTLEGARHILRSGEEMSRASGESAVRFLTLANDLLGVIAHKPEHAAALGLNREDPCAEAGPAVDETRILAAIEDRRAAKKAKEWKRADEIRADLAADGIVLVDHPDGTVTWSAG